MNEIEKMMRRKKPPPFQNAAAEIARTHANASADTHAHTVTRTHTETHAKAKHAQQRHDASFFASKQRLSPVEKNHYVEKNHVATAKTNPAMNYEIGIMPTNTN